MTISFVFPVAYLLALYLGSILQNAFKMIRWSYLLFEIWVLLEQIINAEGSEDLHNGRCFLILDLLVVFLELDWIDCD